MAKEARNKEVKMGRPPKFSEPRRPVTVTLPERTLRQLAGVDRDRAKAIARAADIAAGEMPPELPPVRVIRVGEGKALILVGRSRALARIPWLRLAEIAPAQYLLVVPTGTSVERLEVAILDQLDDLKPSESAERALLAELREQLCRNRRQSAVSKEEILLISV